MKKVLYSLALVLLGLTSCTSFDDAVTENYGAGPAIDVNVTAGLQTDSAFTVTLAPAAGAAYYAYVIDKSDEAEELDAQTLLKGGYGNSVIKVANEATKTVEIKDAAPNSTYQVYAVAASDKGIVGDITVKSIKTTDKFTPTPRGIASTDTEARSVVVVFSENVTRGAGAVTAKYYKEWDIMNPVDVAPEDIEVSISGKNVTFAAPEVPAGSYLCFSYEAGAFKDATGNGCAALNSGLNMNTGKFVGIALRADVEPFEIDEEWVTAPENEQTFSDWEAFKGEITFPFDIYRNVEDEDAGAVCVIYATEGRRAVTYQLNAEEYSIEGNKLYFTLPEAPVSGDLISVKLEENAVTDVYGNYNEEFIPEETYWTYSTFKPTVANIVGTFEIVYVSYWSEDGSAESMGAITIEEDAENEGFLTIKNLYLEGSEIKGMYDLESGKIYIMDDQVLGKISDKDGNVYTTLFYTADGTDAAAFTVNANGTMTADGLWGIYVINDADAEDKGWVDVAKVSMLVPVKAEARKAAARAKSFKAMKVKKGARVLKKSNRK